MEVSFLLSCRSMEKEVCFVVDSSIYLRFSRASKLSCNFRSSRQFLAPCYRSLVRLQCLTVSGFSKIRNLIFLACA